MADPHTRARLDRECAAYARYLTRHAVAGYVLEKYADAAGGNGGALPDIRVRAWFLFKDADGQVRELEAQRLLSDP